MEGLGLLEVYLNADDLSSRISSDEKAGEFIKGAYLNNLVSNYRIENQGFLNYFESFYNDHSEEFRNMDKERLKQHFLGILATFVRVSSVFEASPVQKYSKFKSLHSRDSVNWLVDNMGSVAEAYLNVIDKEGLIDGLMTYKYSDMKKNIWYVYSMYKGVDPVPDNLLEFNEKFKKKSIDFATNLAYIAKKLQNFDNRGFLAKFRKKKIIERIKEVFDISDGEIREIFRNRDEFIDIVEDYYRKVFK